MVGFPHITTRDMERIGILWGMSTTTWAATGHLLGLEGLSREQLHTMLDDAERFLPAVEGVVEPEPVVEPVEEAGGKSDGEAETEPEDEDGPVYSEDEVETISWEFKGKDYELDEKTGKVYAEDEVAVVSQLLQVTADLTDFTSRSARIASRPWSISRTRSCRSRSRATGSS